MALIISHMIPEVALGSSGFESSCPSSMVMNGWLEFHKQTVEGGKKTDDSLGFEENRWIKCRVNIERYDDGRVEISS